MNVDLIGKKFTRLTVSQYVGVNKWKQHLWLCQCCCGKEKVIVANSLKNGDTKSCGCLQKETVIRNNTRHNHARRQRQSKIYTTWQSMIQRCTDKNCRDYILYGRIGIVVCERWLKFENFLKDIGGPPTKIHSLDRINNNKGYCKSNCRWATPKQQARNKSNNRLITLGKKTQCLSAWAEECDIDYKLLWKRICVYGWSMQKSISTPKKKRKEVSL